MRTRRPQLMEHPSASANRSGYLMVFFAILLVMLLGFVGLVFDIGQLHHAQRRAQNAADAAAMAAAMARHRGFSDEEALAEANFLRSQNSPASFSLSLNAGTANALNMPPVAGPHQDMPDFVEAYVTVPVQTLFIHILGVERNRQVAARAVAGQEPPAGGEGVIVLDPQAIPGIGVSGSVNSSGSTESTIVRVDGGVLVNSLGNGYNQWGQWINTFPMDKGNTDPAISTQTTNSDPVPSVEAKSAIVAGGVSSTNAAHFKMFGDANYPNGENPLFAGTRLLFPDPLREFSVPRLQPTEVVDHTQGSHSGNFTFGTGQTETLEPGLYNHIVIESANVTFSKGNYIIRHLEIKNNSNVTFEAGIYVISPPSPPTTEKYGIKLTGTSTIVGNEVMFYLTGSNYMDDPDELGYGFYDARDDEINDKLDGPLPRTLSAPDENTQWNTIKGGKASPPGDDPYEGSVDYATMTINIGDGVLDLKGLAETGGEFDNMLFYARRRNNNPISIGGNAGDAQISLKGIVYAKWSLLDVSGGGQWKAQFVVGSLKVSGGGVVTIQGFGYSWGTLAKQVYLVE